MPCPRCNESLTETKVGHLCIGCGFVVQPLTVPAAIIISHSELVHAQPRAIEPEEEGDKKSEVLPRLRAFTWVSVEVNRFSYYAIVFVLVIIATGLGYNLFGKQIHQRANETCRSDITHTSSDPVQAGIHTPSPKPFTPCNK